MDTTLVGTIAADLMDAIADDHPDAQVGSVAVVAEIREPDTTYVTYQCSDERAWIQRGLLSEAARAAGLDVDEP